MKTRIALSLLAITSLIGCTVPDRNVISQADTMNTQLKPAVIEDPQLSSYLQQVGERILASARELDAEHVGPESHFQQNNSWMFGSGMKFHFVNSKTLNAFTTGGEHMYIYNELFQQCKSEEELAAVMSHEYAHVYSRHVAKGMQRQYTALAAAAALGGAGYLAGGKEQGQQYAAAGAGIGMAGAQFLNMGFTRKDENEADKWGFQFYSHAGWDPNHFADFFKTMIAKGYDKTPAMMSDHPTLASRVQATEQRVKELPPDAEKWRRPPIADEAKFAALQRRAADLAKRLPDDKSIQNSQQLLAALPRSCIVPTDPPDAIQARQEIAQKAEAAQQQQQGQKKPKRRARPVETGESGTTGSQVISSGHGP
jgi:predicted Zn-dependent protease